MFDFEFYNPTRIIFGRDKENRIGDAIQSAGFKKVLFVYGKNSIKKSGLYERVAGSLNGAGVAFVEHGGVLSNPVLSHTREGINVAKQRGIDAVLAVGGGSVIDEAKAIAVGAVADDDIWNYFVGKEVLKALPVFTVLTLAATGSEMNGNSVITNEETRQKYNIASAHVYPRVSILNPELTFSVPADYTSYGAVDTIAHVIEAYFTKKPGTYLQDMLVESIIRSIINTHRIIMEDPENYDARAEFMWTATLALNGLTPAGVGEYSFPNHMIEHALSALYNIPHGAGLSIVIPAWMKWYMARNRPQFERFAQKIFKKNRGEEGIDALERWFACINAPIRLEKVNIPAADIPMIAENAEGLAKMWGIAETYNKKTIAEILRLAV
jgi:hypothetical protein